MTREEKLAELEKIAAEIREFKGLEIARLATNAVPGEGNPEAEVLFVGEAPGKDEDLQGRPFVGRSGKLLTEMIESVGWQRSDVFITNVVKYRPPNNRDPNPEEVRACADWLTRQVAAIQPKVIALLGRHSLNRFLPGLKISEVHGQAKRTKDGLVYVPLYHPAVALYNPPQKAELAADFAKLPGILDLARKQRAEQPLARAEELMPQLRIEL